ncbi:MAG: pseudouridine synthase [Gammaproteobacteria bacterium]|nr:MAG: pseudouridine synthase [Gammaproteobacteria bacterium]
MRLIALNKPFGVLSQFSDDSGRTTLQAFVPVPGVYPAGRLDRDSEGLLLLTDDGTLQHRISAPRHKLVKRYLAQVEGLVDTTALEALERGVRLKDGPARARFARACNEPDGLWPRRPPIRERQSIPTSWLMLGIDEGRNRQVRRMTASVNLPTLRLIRSRIGDVDLFSLGLAPGEWCEIDPERHFPGVARRRSHRRSRSPRRRQG